MSKPKPKSSLAQWVEDAVSTANLTITRPDYRWVVHTPRVASLQTSQGWVMDVRFALRGGKVTVTYVDIDLPAPERERVPAMAEHVFAALASVRIPDLDPNLEESEGQS
jgi:hypothetical protein